MPSYDARGNLTSAGAPTYTYSTKNELAVRSDTGVQFTYGPGGRFDAITSGAVTTRFQYDGVQIAAELSGAGAVLRRYVFGPGDDEPLVWYEGAGTSS